MRVTASFLIGWIAYRNPPVRGLFSKDLIMAKTFERAQSIHFLLQYALGLITWS